MEQERHPPGQGAAGVRRAAGHAAHREHRWDDAYQDFHAVAAVEPLTPTDVAALADAAWWLGRTDESLGLSEEVYRHHLAGEEVSQAARLAIEIGFLWLLRGELTLGSGWISRARRLLDGAPESAAHGYLAYLAVEEHLGAGRFDDAIETTRWMQDVARRHEDPTLCALALVLEGAAELRRGNVAVGMGIVDEAMLPVHAGEVDPSWAGNLYCHVMDLCFELLDLPRARAWTDATERWCDQHSNAAMFAGICRVHRAQLLQVDGSFEAAGHHAARTCEELADMNVMVVAEGHYRVAESHRLRAEHAAAEQAYERARGFGRDPQPGLALLRLAQGKPAVAAAALHAALAAVPEPLHRVPLLVAQTEVAAAGGEITLATEAAGELGSIADAFGSPGIVACAEHTAGVAHLAEGQPLAAIRPLRSGWRAWCELDAPYEAARTRARLAEALAGAGDRETALVEAEAARSAFATLGALDDLRLLEEATASWAGEPTHDADVPGGLSAREIEVLRCVSAGSTNRQIATTLTISEKTVARHLSNIFVKLDVSSRTEAAAFAFTHGLVAEAPD
ncbi:MAG: response regulator transcription factor [Acidimicrobiia bacterium]|nr:response regulator transcription factor [Acidimicrobiia bacterium]